MYFPERLRVVVHPALGIGVVVLPVVIIYLQIKLSPETRKHVEKRLKGSLSSEDKAAE
jgi:hypothetical protein